VLGAWCLVLGAWCLVLGARRARERNLTGTNTGRSSDIRAILAISRTAIPNISLAQILPKA
ncbi:MAG: hypothetical protein WCO60_00005, partial [Verrucomicrobiota bacterium]